VHSITNAMQCLLHLQPSGLAPTRPPAAAAAAAGTRLWKQGGPILAGQYTTLWNVRSSQASGVAPLPGAKAPLVMTYVGTAVAPKELQAAGDQVQVLTQQAIAVPDIQVSRIHCHPVPRPVPCPAFRPCRRMMLMIMKCRNYAGSFSPRAVGWWLVLGALLW